jgi:hypothetical protein
MRVTSVARGSACLLLVLQTSLMAQSPVKGTFAYSRATTAGIPSDSGAQAAHSPFPTAYYIYVVIQKGAAISVAGVCIERQLYHARLRSVDAPVVVDRNVSVPTGQKDTLVKRTSGDVYQVEVGDVRGRCDADRAAGHLAQRHEVVVCLQSAGVRWYGLATRIVPLTPAAAM